MVFFHPHKSGIGIGFAVAVAAGAHYLLLCFVLI
jgi:hypothetical protein